MENGWSKEKSKDDRTAGDEADTYYLKNKDRNNTITRN